MTTVEFTAALGAHATWKSKLQAAIEVGKCDHTVAEVRRDDACQFGRWLHATPGLLQDQRYTTVKALHSRFHEEAARVLAMALAGEKEAALAEVAVGKPFSAISAALTREVVAWRGELIANGHLASHR